MSCYSLSQRLEVVDLFFNGERERERESRNQPEVVLLSVTFSNPLKGVCDNFAPREHCNTEGFKSMRGSKIQLTNWLRITLNETISVSSEG